MTTAVSTTNTWQSCTAYYEDEILPGLQQQMQKLKDDLAAAAAQNNVAQAFRQFMLDQGCIEVNINLWDCRQSQICTDPNAP